MKWLLVVIIFQSPVKTDLVFDSLEACLKKESEMRDVWAASVNKTLAAQESLPKERRDQVRAFEIGRVPSGTCIPTK